MTIDKEKLKALAEAANAVTTDVSITMAVGADSGEVKAVQDYLQVAMPKTILALLEEIERLDMDNRSLKGSCSRLGAEHAGMSRLYKKANRMQFEARQERDQLKAENDELRKRLEGLVHVSDATGWEEHTCGEIAKARTLLGMEVRHG